MSFDCLSRERLAELASAWSCSYLLLEGGLDPAMEKRINAIDPFTHRTWIYEETRHEWEKTKGPLLVWADAGSPLLHTFLHEWPQENMGILLTSSQPRDAVSAHLRTLSQARMADGREALFRLHEPRRLRGIAEAYDDNQEINDAMMGPLSHIAWCEWHGDQGAWYIMNHSSSKGSLPLAAPWLIDQRLIDAAARQKLDYLSLCIARQIIALDLPSLFRFKENDITEQVRAICHKGYDLGFARQKELAGYAELSFRHQLAVIEPGKVNTVLSDRETPPPRRLREAFALLNEEQTL